MPTIIGAMRELFLIARNPTRKFQKCAVRLSRIGLDEYPWVSPFKSIHLYVPVVMPGGVAPLN